jgi:beta-lactamase class A
MLTRSDNTASNCLIDLVGRESITENILYRYGWQGSEITRKFLDRTKEEKSYQSSKVTMSCARHFAEFFALVDSGKMVSLWVSQKLRDYMYQFNRQSKLGLWLPDVYTHYYAKGGWLETNLYHHGILSLIKSIIKRGWAIIRWSNDAGVVTLPSGKRYVVVVFSITKTIFPWHYFPMQDVARKIVMFLDNRKTLRKGRRVEKDWIGINVPF